MSIFFRLVSMALILGVFSSELSGQCGITVNAGDDIYLCAPPSPTQLDGSISGDYLSFTWTPTSGLTGANTLNPTATVTQNATYVLSGTAADFSSNLVDNGDFESGNTGFTSDYGYSPGDLVPEGLYDIIDNPQLDHPGFSPCDDHTSGTGNMMVVNGSGTPNQNVWCETVPVNPNSQYVLSAWVTTVVASSPALLQFSINGSTVGPIFNAPGSLCNWQNYFQTWNSGNSTSATICIVNQNTTLGGNDFALDDIVFAPTCIVRDTVQLFVVNVTAVASPAIVSLPCDGAELTLNGTGSSTGANISYLWETTNGNIVSGETTLNPVINAAGTYTLTVSYTAPDGTLCEKTASVDVVLNPNQLTAWIEDPAPLGCGATTTTLLGNSNQPGFSTYSWSTLDGNIVSGQDLRNCVVDQIGTYFLTVTNTATGCTATAEATVTATTTPPIAIATASDTLTCFQDTITLSSTGSSSGNNIVYSWTTTNGHFISGQNTATALVDSIGTYILNVTNSSTHCTSKDTVVVIGNLTPPAIFLPPQQQITCTSDTITMIIFLFPPPFVIINWTASNGGHIVSGQFTPNPQVDSMGDYHVTVQDPINGCISGGSVVVITNMNYPVATIAPPGGITCQSPSISLSGNGSSTGPNFGYTWTASNGGNIVSGENSLNPVVNAAGDYTLTVLDSINGCTSMASTSVMADTNVVTVIANAPDTLDCATQAVLLNANGSSSGANITYSWTTSNGNILSGADTATPLISAPGTYQLLLTNTSNGCSGTDLAVAIQNLAQPQIVIDLPGEITCVNTTQTLVAHNNSSPGSYLYSWVASNGGNITMGANGLTPTVDMPGTYTLTATNQINGCSSTVSTTVTLAAGVPLAMALADGPLNCIQHSQQVGSTGSSSGTGITYLWSSSANGNIVGSNIGATITVDAPGIYTLLVTNQANGCTASTSAAVLLDTLAPAAVVTNNGPELTCTVNPLALQGDGTGMASWNTTDGNIVGGSNSFVIMIDEPGTYVLTTTDPNNGCTAVASVLVTEDIAPPSLNATPPSVLSCLTSAQTLQVQNLSLPGNFTYNWTASNGGNIVSGGNGLNPLVDTQGTYQLLATNIANGCTASLTVTVVENIAAPSIQIASAGQITCTNPTQTIQAQNLSLPGNFVYNWTASNGGNITGGNGTLMPQVNMGGDYLLVATNSDNGCTSTASVNVVQDNAAPTADAGADATLTCNLSTLTINGTGAGSNNLTYAWVASNGGNILTGGNSATPTINSPGLFTLTVTNAINGCTASDVVEIFNDASAPTVNAGTAPQLTCSLTQTSLNATASTGNNFSYSWTASNGGNILTGINTLSPTVNEPGLYTLVVTNTTNGCTRSSTVTLTEDITPPTVDAGQGATLTCATTSLSLTGTSGGGSATFAWQTAGGNIVSGGNTLTPTINGTGTYTLITTLLSNGCTASDVVMVGIDTISPTFTIQQPQQITCALTSISLNASVQQPAAGSFSASWSSVSGHFVSGQNSLNPVVDAQGTYILTVVNNQNGCDEALAIPVFQNILAPNAQAAPGGTITCAVQNLTLSGAGSSGPNGVTYLWTASNGGQLLNGMNTLTPTVGSSGTYTLLVTNNNNGCTATATTTVQNNTTAPTAAVSQPGTLTCSQTTVTLNATGSSTGANFSANWSGNILSGQGTLTPVVNASGTYILTITNSTNGCSSTAQSTVAQNTTLPGADAGLPAELHCNLPVAPITGSSPSPGTMTYSWSTQNGSIQSGASNQTAMVNAPGQYSLTVTNPANGCTSTDVVAVTEIPAPDFEAEIMQPDCHNLNGMLDFGGITGGKGPFEYSIDGGQSYGNQSIINGLTPDTYTLVVSDALGCTASETAVVNQPFIPLLEIADIGTIDFGDSIQLNPTTNILPGGVISWAWSPASGLSCIDCENPWAKPYTSTVYFLTVRDQNGCEAEAEVRILVKRNRSVYAPNVFSPNDDGLNDYFVLFGKGVKTIQKLQVFDRWGDAIYQGEQLEPGDEPAGWDGTYKGTAMNPAVFVWWAKVEFIDGEVEFFSGDVTLLR